MKNLGWLIYRLKAMSIAEIIWRVQQKIIEKIEYKKIYMLHKPVTEITYSSKLKELNAKGENLGINWQNENWQLFDGLDLFGVYDYSKYKKNWNAGFQTNNSWPKEQTGN